MAMEVDANACPDIVPFLFSHIEIHERVIALRVAIDGAERLPVRDEQELTQLDSRQPQQHRIFSSCGAEPVESDCVLSLLEGGICCRFVAVVKAVPLRAEGKTTRETAIQMIGQYCSRIDIDNVYRFRVFSALFDLISQQTGVRSDAVDADRFKWRFR